jgi:DNA gyrase/topoisomerase IV subunit B
MKFFTDNTEYIEYVQSSFCKENTIADNKKKVYTKKEITKILYNNIDYLNYINHICNIYAINPKLLEFLLCNKDLDFNKFKKAIEKQYQFLTVTKENGTIMIRGLVESAYQTVFFNQNLLNACKDIIYLIDRSEDFYYINGKKSTLYDLMYLFRTYEPKVSRYKGLGEMNSRLLGESTVIPGMGRTLKQYTIEDAKAELKKITALQTDKAAFIKGIKVRKEDII